MEVRSCVKCRKLFQSYGQSVCPVCLQEVDRQFDLVKNYLYDNPGASMENVCRETKVDQHLIVRWLREGRLITDDSYAALLECITCGAPIRSGRYCEKCNNELRRALQDTAKAMSGQQDDKRARTAEESRRKESKMHIKS